MADNSDTIKKRLLLALEKSLGIVSTACKKAKVSRQTYYEYYKNDPDFKEAVDDIAELSLDFAESKLLQSINNGSDTATIFYLKTKGKKRGYVEKTEIGGTVKNLNYNSTPITKEELQVYHEILEAKY